MLLADAIKAKGSNDYFFTDEGVLGYHITGKDGCLSYDLEGVPAREGLDLPTIDDICMCYSGYHAASSVAKAMSYKKPDLGAICVVRNYGIVCCDTRNAKGMINDIRTVSTNRCIELLINRDCFINNLNKFRADILLDIHDISETVLRTVCERLDLHDAYCRYKELRSDIRMAIDHFCSLSGDDSSNSFKYNRTIIRNFYDAVLNEYGNAITQGFNSIVGVETTTTNKLSSWLTEALIGLPSINVGCVSSLSEVELSYNGYSFFRTIIDNIRMFLSVIDNVVGPDNTCEIIDKLGKLTTHELFESISNEMDMCALCYTREGSIINCHNYKSFIEYTEDVTTYSGTYFDLDGNNVVKDSFPTLLVDWSDYCNDEKKYKDILQSKINSEL